MSCWHCGSILVFYTRGHLTTSEENVCSFHTKTHFCTLKHTRKKLEGCHWRFSAIYTLCYQEKFSFPTFFRLQYCELVTWQLRVFDGCFHTNYIAWHLKLNHWFRSNRKTHNLITIGTPPLNLLKPKLWVTYTALLIKPHCRNLFNLITIGTLPLSKNLCYLQHFNVYCQHRLSNLHRHLSICGRVSLVILDPSTVHISCPQVFSLKKIKYIIKYCSLFFLPQKQHLLHLANDSHQPTWN